MKKLISKIKNYKPSKHICYLYFLLPISLCFCINLTKENDIWFLLNHGKYVLNNGFPVVEPFSMHENFSFVMQQWLSAVIFYLSHLVLKQYGLLIVIFLINCLILYFLYKLCMTLSENKLRLSIIISCITDTLLITLFFQPRPWLFTMLNLIIVLYIMELYYKKNNKKALYYLPLISILQINLHSSMWFMIYLFILPYAVCLIINKIKDKRENKIYKLLIAIICMFLVGFINPYGIDNIIYIFKSYGNEYMNTLIMEMLPTTLKFCNLNNSINIYGCIFFVLLFIQFGIYIYLKKGKLQLRHCFLFLGVSVLGLSNIRSIFLFIIGTIPFLASYLKDYFKPLTKEENNYKISKKEQRKYIMIIIIFIISAFCCGCIYNKKFTDDIEKGIDIILKNNDAVNVILYTNYDNGSYAEYRGLKPYIDTRAEVFLKINNKKEEILKEFYRVSYGYIKYQDFIDKYNFTHMIIMKNETIYQDACNDDDYKVIYKGKDYKVFERIKE